MQLKIFNGIREIINKSHESITEECKALCKSKRINNPRKMI